MLSLSHFIRDSVCSVCEKRHSPVIVCETWLLCAADWILQGEAMKNVMTTDVRGWRLMWFCCLLWWSTNVCNLSADHKNAAIPSGACGSLYLEADARHTCVGQYYALVHRPLLVLLKMQELDFLFFFFSSRSNKYPHILNKERVSWKTSLNASVCSRQTIIGSN